MEDHARELPPQQELQDQFLQLRRHFQALKNREQQTRRLACLGTAAAMLAHEYNNLMTPVVGYARHAADSGDPELMAKALRMTVRQAAIVTAMSDRILGLVDDGPPSVRSVNLADAVNEAISCLGASLPGGGVALHQRIDPGLCVCIDPGQLQQVLFNLLRNAREAIGESGGAITVTADRPDDGEKFVRILVTDTGRGIAAEDLESIFDAFHSGRRSPAGGDAGDSDGWSAEDHRGSGLGLTLCREIVEEHGGHITVQSEIGIGTTFNVVLPVGVMDPGDNCDDHGPEGRPACSETRFREAAARPQACPR